MPNDARVSSLPLTVRLQSVAPKMVFLIVMAEEVLPPVEEALTPPNATNPSAARTLVPVTDRFDADATTEVSVALMTPPTEEAKPMHATLVDPAEMMLQFDAVMEVPKAKTRDLLKPYGTIPMETTACLPVVLMMLCEATTTVAEAEISTHSPIETNPMEARQWVPVVLRLHSVAAMEVLMAVMDATVFGTAQLEVNPIDATLLNPVAVMSLPDAAKVVFAAVMFDESWLKDAKPNDATASLPEADTRHPTQAREVPVAMMVELERYVAKPILATPFDPLAVTLHLNAVILVIVVVTVDDKYKLEETMPMDTTVCEPPTARLHSVAASTVFMAVIDAALFDRGP